MSAQSITSERKSQEDASSAIGQALCAHPRRLDNAAGRVAEMRGPVWLVLLDRLFYEAARRQGVDPTRSTHHPA